MPREIDGAWWAKRFPSPPRATLIRAWITDGTGETVLHGSRLPLVVEA
jgi:hypothetical protein